MGGAIIWGFRLKVLKSRQQAPKEGVYANPHVTKLRLNYSFSPSRNGILKQSIRVLLMSTIQVMCLLDSLPGPEGKQLCHNQPGWLVGWFFALCNYHVPACFCV